MPDVSAAYRIPYHFERVTLVVLVSRKPRTSPVVVWTRRLGGVGGSAAAADASSDALKTKMKASMRVIQVLAFVDVNYGLYMNIAQNCLSSRTSQFQDQLIASDANEDSTHTEAGIRRVLGPYAAEDLNANVNEKVQYM